MIIKADRQREEKRDYRKATEEILVPVTEHTGGGSLRGFSFF